MPGSRTVVALVKNMASLGEELTNTQSLLVTLKPEEVKQIALSTEDIVRSYFGLR